MKAALQVQPAEHDYMDRADIEALADAVTYNSAVLSATERLRIEKEIRIWEFGKAALLCDDAAQGIKRQLQHQSRIKESKTFWESLVPMNDDEACAFDALMCKLLELAERKVLMCQYQYHRSEDAGARVLHLGRYHFRSIRDGALQKLHEKIVG